MGYKGDVYQIKCDGGGMTGNPNVDLIESNMMIHPTRNLILHNGGWEKRGGTAHVNDAAFTGTPQLMGIYDFTLQNGNQFILAAGKDGKIYTGADASTTIKTGMSTTAYFCFVTFENTCFICDGESEPQTWDGAAAATSAITSSPTDWAGADQPQQFVVHGRGESRRLWAIGALPDAIYASANGDGNDFSDANVFKLTIETEDGTGVVGGVEFKDQLIVFSKTKAFTVDDDDTDTSNWGYSSASWFGGVAHWRLIIRTPNDIVCMMEDGEIYSVVAAVEYNDYKMASLTRPSYMHKWIKDNVKLSDINKFHGVYDPVMRAIKIFIVRNGQTEVDTALVYFLDREPAEAWMVHDNQSNDSGYSASCSALVRVGTGDFQIYTGDYDGNVWKLEQTNRNDNSAAFAAGPKTSRINMDDPRSDKRFKRLWVITKPQGDYDLTIDWWIDDVQQTQQTVSLNGTGGLLDSFVLGTSLLGGDELINKEVTLGNKGRRVQFHIYNNSADEDFYISQLLIDYKVLGKKPAE